MEVAVSGSVAARQVRLPDQTVLRKPDYTEFLSIPSALEPSLTKVLHSHSSPSPGYPRPVRLTSARSG